MLPELGAVRRQNPLDLGQTSPQFAMGRQPLPKLDEGAHDGDIHLGSLWTAEDAGEHGHPLLGEGQWSVFDVFTALQDSNLES